MSLSALCKQLEDMGKAADMDAAAGLLPQAEEAYAAAEQALKTPIG